VRRSNLLILLGIASGFALAMTASTKTKIPSSTSGTKEFLRGTTRIALVLEFSSFLVLRPTKQLSNDSTIQTNASLFAITGFPVNGYFCVSPFQSLFRDNRRVQSGYALPMGAVLGSHLALPTR
jgi:hypothetical protein